jgi:hypothetical protein
MPFPEEEYLALPRMGSGTASITGQAFLRTRGGDVKTAAGEQVILNPLTSYSKEWYALSKAGAPIAEPDERLKIYYIQQVADATGRFTFKNVPAGAYFVTTTIYWEAPGAGLQGGRVADLVTLTEGQTLEIILSERNLIGR